MLNKIVLGIACIAASFSINAQVYTVTRQDLGFAGSLDIIMADAIMDANAGNNVEIEFDAPGLVQVDSPLPVLSIASGGIFLHKKVGGIHPFVQQGIEFAGSPSSVTLTTGFVIQSNSRFSSLRFENLRVEDFIDYVDPLNSSNNIYRKGIELSNINNVAMQGVTLENNSTEMFISGNAANLFFTVGAIVHNDLQHPAIEIISGASGVDPDFISIRNNQIISAADSETAGIMVTLQDVNNGEILIRGNQIKYFNEGIAVKNYVTENVDPSEAINIISNTFEQTEFSNISLESPMAYWKVEGNTFDSKYTQISLSSYYELPNIYGINFIEANPIDANLSNQNNHFQTGGKFSFFIDGNFGAGNKLMGLDLAETIQIRGGSRTIVRASKIVTGSFERPIDLKYGGNESIPSPEILYNGGLALSGNNLIVKYKLQGLYPENGDFVVDFYKSNDPGSILDYLGSEVHSGDGTYTTTIAFTPGMLHYWDRVLITVTSLGDQPGAVSIGTSEEWYNPIRCPGCALKFCYPEQICAGIPATFENGSFNCLGDPTFIWDFGDGSPQSPNPVHTFAAAGNFLVRLIIPATDSSCQDEAMPAYVTVTDDCAEPCKDCITSFAPTPGQQYVISAWVQQDNSESSITYTTPSISLEFTNNGTLGPFVAKGEIIDGWQRIDEMFTVPGGATDIFIKLSNGGVDNTAYFDDIRIHPLKASLKSFVYDPVSMRLMAELDENNYATFYEYDEEGKLIRVKKETERGVKTIKESVNSTHKNVQ